MAIPRHAEILGGLHVLVRTKSQIGTGASCGWSKGKARIRGAKTLPKTPLPAPARVNLSYTGKY